MADSENEVPKPHSELPKPLKRLLATTRRNLAAVLLGVIVTLAGAGALAVVTPIFHGAPRPRLSIQVLSPAVPVSKKSDWLNVSVTISNDGHASAFGCDVAYREVSASGGAYIGPLSVSERLDAGDWTIESGDVHQVAGKVDLRTVEDAVSYWEVWVQCQQPRIVSASRFFVLDLPDTYVTVPYFSEPGCQLQSACANRSVNLLPFVHRPTPALEGGGADPTAGTGSFGGRPFRARSALLYETRAGISLYVFPFNRTCAAGAQLLILNPVSAIEVDTTLTARSATRAPLNHPMTHVTATYDTGTYQPGGSMSVPSMEVMGYTRLILTRVDTYPGGQWHGRLQIADTPDVVADSFSGTFAATWCGP